MKMIVALLTLVPQLLWANTILYSHSGDANPATEGWNVGGSGSGVVVGPINDMGTPAWMVDDNGAGIIYRGFWTPAQEAEALSAGWTASIDMRLVDNTGFNLSPYMRVNMGSTTFGLFFGEESDGDTMVAVFGSGVVYTNQGSGSSYHNYEMVYDPVTMTADLLVDGLEVFSDFTGDGNSNPSSSRGMIWGAGAGGPSTGHGNYSSVLFGTIPEPSATALIFPGILLAAWTFRRWRRTPEE